MEADLISRFFVFFHRPQDLGGIVDADQVLNFALGKHNRKTTDIFIEGLRLATSRKNYQLTADGFAAYPSDIENTFSDQVDLAQLNPGLQSNA